MNWTDYANGSSIAQDIAPAAFGGEAQRRLPRPQRMLISDIDNTLTGCRTDARRLSAFAQGAVDRSRTGRSFVEARRLLREWDMPVPRVLIASVGSEIYWRTQRGEDYAATLQEGWDANAVLAALKDMPGLVPQAAIEQRRSKCSLPTIPPCCPASAPG